MAERRKIGLIYSYNENWIGGTYYIENMIQALNSQEDENKPHLTILSYSEADFSTLQQRLSYPYWSFKSLCMDYNLLERVINKLTKKIFGQPLIEKFIDGIDSIFPNEYIRVLHKIPVKINWIPDFQEHFIPEVNKPKDIEFRKRHQFKIAMSMEHLVLSSKNALHHFKTLYPQHTVKTHVLPFAVTHPELQEISIKSLLKKYNLPQTYFLSPNQFWKHKNHIVIIKAVELLKENGFDNITIAFTGIANDCRNPGYFKDILKEVETRNLHTNIIFLGFIDRVDQLQLMKYAIAIIQPSLFEGWSTVIEDCKSLNKKVIASAIEVHKEQLANSNASYFLPEDYEKLADFILKTQDEGDTVLYDSFDYSKNILAFGSLTNQILRVDANSQY